MSYDQTYFSTRIDLFQFFSSNIHGMSSLLYFPAFLKALQNAACKTRPKNNHCGLLLSDTLTELNVHCNVYCAAKIFFPCKLFYHKCLEDIQIKNVFCFVNRM